MTLTREGLFSPSQTNTALYVQLHEAGFAIEEIGRIQRAYRMACLMFNGRYRKTGRPFICHAVGAASSVARFGGDVDQILAAMFHAAYDSAEYPDGMSSRQSAAHRRWVEDHIGARAERLVARYDSFGFDKGDPERLAATEIRTGDEDILFLALAHEVDDLADGGLVFAPKYGASVASRIAACALLARRLGHEEMASTFESYGDYYKGMGWASAFQAEKLEGFRIAPNLRNYYRLLRARWRGGSVRVL